MHRINNECNEQTLRNLQKKVKYAEATRTYELKYVKLDLELPRIILLTDASFGNALEGSSQTAFTIPMADGSNSDNILHYESKKCRRITRCVMAAELLALVTRYDQAFAVKSLMKELLGRKLSMDAYIDSRTTLD